MKAKAETPVTQVPFVDLVAQYAEVKTEVMPAVQEALETASYIGGALVARFEEEYAAFAGVEHCVGVGNGTDALELALRAADVGPSDEVIIPANSFVATAEAVSRIGAIPVLVDVDEERLLMDPSLVDKAVTSRTRAIVPVHLFGQTAPVERLLEIADSFGLAVIEDAAQSQGASRLGKPTGSTGLAAGVSFYPGKNLGAAGDAGAVVTSDGEVAQRIRKIAAHGSDQKYVHDVVGLNSRLDTIQAIVLRAKLARLSEWNDMRRAAAERYHRIFADIPGVCVPNTDPDNFDVWHLYVIQVENRDRVLAELSRRGVGAGIHYPTPIHLTGTYRSAYDYGDFPVTEAAAGRILSLPMFPHITAAQQQFVSQQLSSAMGYP